MDIRVFVATVNLSKRLSRVSPVLVGVNFIETRFSEYYELRRAVNRFLYAGNWTRIRHCSLSAQITKPKETRAFRSPDTTFASCFQTRRLRSTWERATLSGSCSQEMKTENSVFPTGTDWEGERVRLCTNQRKVFGVLLYERVFRIYLQEDAK